MTTDITRQERIRDLNDAFRCAQHLVGAQIALGDLVITRGVADRGNGFINRAVHAVREFSTFTEANDPYGEHDFGAFELDSEKLFWKIDCYDYSVKWGSPDPADPSVTRRVLTIMFADEY